MTTQTDTEDFKDRFQELDLALAPEDPSEAEAARRCATSAGSGRRRSGALSAGSRRREAAGGQQQDEGQEEAGGGARHGLEQQQDVPGARQREAARMVEEGREIPRELAACPRANRLSPIRRPRIEAKTGASRENGMSPLSGLAHAALGRGLGLALVIDVLSHAGRPALDGPLAHSRTAAGVCRPRPKGAKRDCATCASAAPDPVGPILGPTAPRKAGADRAPIGSSG